MEDSPSCKRQPHYSIRTIGTIGTIGSNIGAFRCILSRLAALGARGVFISRMVTGRIVVDDVLYTAYTTALFFWTIERPNKGEVSRKK